MKQKLLILAAGMLAGIAIVYVLPRFNKPAALPVVDAEIPSEPAESRDGIAPSAAPSPPTQHVQVVPTVAPPVPAAPPPSAWTRLAEKYGTEKTVLSSKISSNIAGVMIEGMELAQTAARNSGSSNLVQAATREILRGATRELGLTEAQQQRAAQIIEPEVTRRVGAFNDLMYAMHSEPEQLMETILAGDALARQQISRDEYDRITLPTRTMLQQMTRYIAGGPGGSNSARTLVDPEIAAQINTILTPEQQTKFAEVTAAITERAAARQAAQARSGIPFQLGEIPVMQLDQLDQSVASVRQMTEAARQMMNAMQNLKQANPKTTPAL